MGSNSTSTNSDELEERINSLEGIPPFPATASQILMECQKPEVQVGVVSKLVECEPAVSSKIIQLANSPLYGANRPIVSVNHAIVLLGFRTVTQMAIAISTGTLFEQGGESEVARHRKETFRQSLACAAAARLLAMEFDAANSDEAFLCGVMQDVGKLVLFDATPDRYCELLDGSDSNDTTLMEQSAFGIDHAEIGRKCGSKWGFPAEINRAIGNHHRPINDTNCDLSKALIAANYFCRRWSLAGDSSIEQPENDDIEEAFSASTIASIKDECPEQFEAIIEICAAN